MPGILYEERNAVAVLTLNSPHDYNALNIERMEQINAALDKAIADPKVRALVLTGAGKGFCSGAQFGDMFTSGAKIAGIMRDYVTPIITKLHDGPKPTVIAVNGPAAGAGVGLALAGDIVIAAKSANFRLSFVKLGAVLDGGTSWLLQRTIGEARARGLALTGDAISGDTAAEWGLIWKCVKDQSLQTEAFVIADRLAQGPPLALNFIRRQLNAARATALEEALEEEARLQALAFVTDDIKEGAEAFLQRRTPRFSGR